ncbi:HEAT repeat domain-containing protein [Flagellimonas sp. CMM7]|uniref:HEAT repeat domain-containing protein n=1 Tax=Flagellimonas sp. CMM7 TaxID=2654676 RepID=UPI0013D56573|nr:HEAT repeat domain-containing protein [Flagellimonas sp. CMM7]UII80902.1 HEAT repeat domain-containing protein [Flagellimonas sp. CMM7]
MMNKEKFETQAIDYMSGIMSEDEKRNFEKFLEENSEYTDQFDELASTWKMMNKLDAPEPSPKMDETFFEMLSSEVEKTNSKNGWETLMEGLMMIFKPQLAYGILLLGIGLGIGYYMNSSDNTNSVKNIVSNEETEDVRQKLVLTLLEQPSANQRLQGVSEANKFEDVDEMVIKALLQTLNNDSNVNVRLAAIESLTNYVDKPLVRQGLVKSIPNQESPILQVTLANLMVALQEKASVEPFKQLLKEKQLDTTVQKKIENSIESII